MESGASFLKLIVNQIRFRDWWHLCRHTHALPAASCWPDSQVRTSRQKMGTRRHTSSDPVVCYLMRRLWDYLLGSVWRTFGGSGVCGAGTAASSTGWWRHTETGSSSSDPPANSAVQQQQQQGTLAGSHVNGIRNCLSCVNWPSAGWGTLWSFHSAPMSCVFHGRGWSRDHNFCVVKQHGEVSLPLGWRFHLRRSKLKHTQLKKKLRDSVVLHWCPQNAIRPIRRG